MKTYKDGVLDERTRIINALMNYKSSLQGIMKTIPDGLDPDITRMFIRYGDEVLDGAIKVITKES